MIEESGLSGRSSNITTFVKVSTALLIVESMRRHSFLIRTFSTKLLEFPESSNDSAGLVIFDVTVKSSGFSMLTFTILPPSEMMIFGISF